MQSTKGYCLSRLNQSERYSELYYISMVVPNGTDYFSLNYDCTITYYTDDDKVIDTHYLVRAIYTDITRLINCVHLDYPTIFFQLHIDGIYVFLDTHLFDKPLAGPIYNGFLKEDDCIPMPLIPQPLLIKDDYSRYLTKDLFEYQKYNVQWMINIEQGYQTVSYHDIDNLFRVVNIDGYQLYQHRNSSNLVPKCIESTLKIQKYKINGGILADETGLGKTVTAIALIASTLKNGLKEVISLNGFFETDCTVVMCPKSIVGQWYDMLLQFSSRELSVFKITSITNFKKLTPEIICNLDVLLVPYQFLLGKSYSQFRRTNDFSLDMFKFKRLIADELHEIILQNKYQILENMHFKTKWVLSASPFVKNVTGWLLPYMRIFFDRYDYELDPSHSYIKEFIDKMVRKNTVDSIKETLVLPTIKRVLVKLYQTKLEKILYLDKLGDYREMLKLCTSIYASDAKEVRDYHEPLEQMKERVREGYLKKISDLKNDLTNLETKLTNAKNRWEEINDPQLENLRKVKLQRLDKSIDTCKNRIAVSEQRILLLDSINNPDVKLQCPICYDDIKSIAMTSCGHIFCKSCMNNVIDSKINDAISCPVCREILRINDIGWSDENTVFIDDARNKWGTKIAWILDLCNNSPDSRIIIFSQYNTVLRVIENALTEMGIVSETLKGITSSINKKIQSYRLGTTRVLLMSLETCNSGINLPETTDIILVDTVNNVHSETAEQQAIGRAFRLGNEKQVTVHKLVMFNTIEEQNHYEFTNEGLYE